MNSPSTAIKNLVGCSYWLLLDSEFKKKNKNNADEILGIVFNSNSGFVDVIRGFDNKEI
eukprot:CAMPEP_0114591022 /NCGR_PEP_ID=MMETSP0125-20121206/13171_1 /TAXON_ID=485358 ORGANISM="Aristerostoma sp., Strain ATCC 50986" /NCGR_SAMPLE_ID=MMETSP0125 /ASSEMBLY_ACC=CAM_ASM_000245 /LENGTH=58 /DNA_ID=CAMNT_0001788895 /DNA_START=583 /DNA_END=759 /DNA_ORIENTATION=-